MLDSMDDLTHSGQALLLSAMNYDIQIIMLSSSINLVCLRKFLLLSGYSLLYILS